MGQFNVRQFRHLLRQFERALSIQNNSSCCCGVTLTQCHTLMELYNDDDIQLNELSGKLHLQNSSVSRTVESLVNQGLVSREIPRQNRRATMIRLTREGRQVCETIHKGNDAYYEEAVGAIPADRMKGFIEGFEVLVSKMIEINDREAANK